MPTALIAGLIKTLAIYLCLAICYLIFFLAIRKSNLISKSQLSRFIKHIAIMFAIYFIPFTLLSTFNVLGQHVVAVILSIILVATVYPVSKLVLHIENKKVVKNHPNQE